MPRCRFCKYENAADTDRCANCGAALTTIDQSRDGDNPFSAAQTDDPTTVDKRPLDQAVRQLLANGRKIEAIKLYRERTGAGLADAKAAVEAIERGETQTAAARDATSNRDFDSQLEQLLRSGNKITAIKLYRERTGRGLKDSKNAVEAFAREREIPMKSIGCGASAAVVLVITAALGMVSILW